MAAGQITVLDRALTKIGAGVIDLDNDAFTVVLTTDAQALAASFAGASMDALYSDLTAEVIGAGYAAGGAGLENPTWTRVAAVVTFAADSTAWEALTATAKYAVICRMDSTVSPMVPADILAFFDLETTDPSGRVSAGGDFIINWTGGLFTLARS